MLPEKEYRLYTATCQHCGNVTSFHIQADDIGWIDKITLFCPKCTNSVDTTEAIPNIKDQG